MTVWTFSKLFPIEARYNLPVALKQFDHISYLYEVVEYRFAQVSEAQKLGINDKGLFGPILKLPPSIALNPIAGEEATRNEWSMFVLRAELEAYFADITRFFNLSFVSLNEIFFDRLILGGVFSDEILKIDTVDKFSKFKEAQTGDKLNKLNLNEYNQYLENAWTDWGKYIGFLRNYITHSNALDGKGGYGQVSNGREGYNLLLLPSKNEVLKLKEKLSNFSFYKIVNTGLENGIYLESYKLINETHENFQSLAKKIFSREKLDKLSFLFI